MNTIETFSEFHGIPGMHFVTAICASIRIFHIESKGKKAHITVRIGKN